MTKVLLSTHSNYIKIFVIKNRILKLKFVVPSFNGMFSLVLNVHSLKSVLCYLENHLPEILVVGGLVEMVEVKIFSI